MKFFFKTPEETTKDLSNKLRELRLSKKWKRSTLAQRSGVTEASLRRFEQTGKISLNSFLQLIHALGRMDEIETLLNPPAALSLKDLKTKEAKISKRGTI